MACLWKSKDDKHYVNLNESFEVKIANQDEQLLALVRETDGVGVLPQEVTMSQMVPRTWLKKNLKAM